MSALSERPKRLFLLWAIALVAACACGRDGAALSSDQVKVEVATVGVDRDTGVPYVLLADSGGKRAIPIVIGENEARAIMLAMQGIKPERPLTHDLLRDIIERTGNHVDRVVVTNLRDKVFYATIYLDDSRYMIDSRPSDAIALATAVKAPIYVSANLFEPGIAVDIGTRPLAVTAQGLGLTVQDLTPELAQYFNLKLDSGVLVAQATGAAAKAGIRRGDVILGVAGRPAKSAREFSEDLAALGKEGQLRLDYQRGDRKLVASIAR